MLPHGLKAKCEIARKPENKFKNRYGNIVACKYQFNFTFL